MTTRTFVVPASIELDDLRGITFALAARFRVMAQRHVDGKIRISSTNLKFLDGAAEHLEKEGFSETTAE